MTADCSTGEEFIDNSLLVDIKGEYINTGGDLMSISSG